MPFQTGVNNILASGLPGEVSNVGPIFSKDWIVQNLINPNLNPIGYAYTKQSGLSGIANPGGTGPFVGILGMPKDYALQGDTSGNLQPSYYLKDGESGTMFSTAEMWIDLSTSGNVGDSLSYAGATGQIGTNVVDNVIFFAVPNGKIIERDVSVPGLAKIRITY